MAAPQTPQRPFWIPDMQSIAACAIILICAAALFVRMFHPSGIEDKMLDTMITILFSTCLVGVFQYLFGSSRGSDKKDDTIATALPPAPEPAPVPSATPWWSRLTDEEKSAVTAAVSTDPRVASFVTASQVGAAGVDDLNYLVSKGLLKQDRVATISAK